MLTRHFGRGHMAMHTLELEALKTRPTTISPSVNVEGLLAACRHAEHAFGLAIHAAPSREFRECMGKVRQLLHEFGFQLWTELQRIEGGRSGRFPPNGASLHPNCESS